MALHIFSVDKEKSKCSSFSSSYLRNGRFVPELGLRESGLMSTNALAQRFRAPLPRGSLPLLRPGGAANVPVSLAISRNTPLQSRSQ